MLIRREGCFPLPFLPFLWFKDTQKFEQGFRLLFFLDCLQLHYHVLLNCQCSFSQILKHTIYTMNTKYQYHNNINCKFCIWKCIIVHVKEHTYFHYKRGSNPTRRHDFRVIGRSAPARLF
jgi:hypothetical protein